jgi:phenylacetate-CoA oxygenase PaaI subunit
MGAETRFESTQGMSELCKQGLRNLLTACADTKLLLGYHYGEWTFGTPELEAAVASCSLAQSELGHARLFHAILKKHYGDDPDQLIAERAPSEFANITYLDHEIPDWAGFVAANYVVDLAVTRLLYAMRGSSFQPLRMSLEKMIDEERHHINHGQGWFRTLASDADKRNSVERYVNSALGAVALWFGPPEDPADLALVDAGVKKQVNQEIYQALQDDIGLVASEVGATVAPEGPPSFQGWSPHSRRITDSGPDEEILYHLRGSKNEIYKLC